MLPALLTMLLLVGQAVPVQPAPAIADEPLATPVVAYPAEAKQARIQGTVELQINVDATGHVAQVEAISGPIALREAAVNAYRNAAYKPLLKDGRPVPALIRTHVDFRLKELPPDTDQLVDRSFEPLHARCQTLSAQLVPKSTAEQRDEALEACRAAVAMARRFSPGAELEARTTALNDLVLLLIAPGKASPNLPQAGVLAEEGIALVAGASPHVPAVAEAHITRAEVRSLAGDLRGAAQDCSAAEEVLTTLLDDERENERAGGFRGQMRETLLLHAVVLARDHHPFQARQLRKRAAQI